MRQWTNHHCFRKWLVAWTAPSHYLNQCWNIVNWTLWNKFQWNFNRNSNIFIHENEFESVICEMAAILSRPQCVKLAVVEYTLTHWGWVAHTYIGKLTINSSENGSSPGRYQAIISINAGILLIGPLDQLQWHFNRNSNNFIEENTFENVCEMVSILSRPQCVKIYVQDSSWMRFLVIWECSVLPISFKVASPTLRELLWLPRYEWFHPKQSGWIKIRIAMTSQWAPKTSQITVRSTVCPNMCLG